MTLVYQAAAKADLIDAWLQIADDSIEIADEYVYRSQAICELISAQPDMGVARPDVADGVRSFPIDSHVIYYEIRGHTMSVLRIWHAARDPQTFSVNT